MAVIFVGNNEQDRQVLERDARRLFGAAKEVYAAIPNSEKTAALALFDDLANWQAATAAEKADALYAVSQLMLQLVRILASEAREGG